jgi:hypothetical protein
MADHIGVDTSQLEQLFRDLTEVAELVPAEVGKSVQQTAIEGRKTWQADARSKAGKRTSRYAPSIDYSLRTYGGFGQMVYEARIGPNLQRYGGKQGRGGLIPSLGILEDSPGVRGGGRNSVKVAYEFVEKELDRRLTIAVDQSMKRRGL